MENSILNITVSKYNSYNGKAIDCNLLDYLNDYSLKGKVLNIRSKSTKAERDILKAHLPGITPSAICSPTRSAQNVKAHTGLMAFDIDKLPLQIMPTIKDTIIKIPYVAYCGLSVSGTGFWGLIPVSNKAKHLQHFEAMRLYFKETGIDVPDPEIKRLWGFDIAVKDVCRFRYQSFDENAYFNHKAQVFNYTYEPPVMPKKAYYASSTTNDLFDDFNLNGDVETVLINNGWTYQPAYDKGTRKRYSRPDKQSGVSADYCTERRILYVFTDATNFEAAKGFNPVNVFCQLECNNDFKLCAKKLKNLGYGR